MDDYDEPRRRTNRKRRTLSRSVTTGVGIWVGAAILCLSLAVASGGGPGSHFFPFSVYFVFAGPLSLALWFGFPEELMILSMPLSLLLFVGILRLVPPLPQCIVACGCWLLAGIAHLLLLASMGAFS